MRQQNSDKGEWETIVGIDDVSENSGISEGVRLNEKQKTTFKLEAAQFLKRYHLEQNTAKTI